MTQFGGYLLAGIAAGICSGIFGIGGGIVLVPILVIFFHYTQHAATGTSLVALLLPVGLLGAFNYYKAGKIDALNIKAGLLIAVGMFLGTYLGSLIAMPFSDSTLRKGFSFLLIVIALRLLIAK